MARADSRRLLGIALVLALLVAGAGVLLFPRDEPPPAAPREDPDAGPATRGRIEDTAPPALPDAPGLRLAGRVVRNGEPVAGATVTIERGMGGRGEPTTTGPDGRFALSLLPGEATLAVRWDDGIRRFPIPMPLPDGRDFDIGGPARLEGRVIDEEGAPIAGAVIRLKNREAAVERSLTSDEAGRFAADGLPGGRAALTARAEGWLPWPGMDVVLAAGHPFATTVRLSRGVRVTGRLVDEESQAPLAGARVTALACLTHEPLGPEFACDREGRFAFDANPRTAPLLVVSQEAATAIVAAGQIPGEGGGLGDVEVPTPRRILGVVTDDAGRPVAGLEVRTPGMFVTGSVVTTDDHGRFVSRKSDTSGFFIARVEPERFLQWRVDLEENETVRLVVPGSVTLPGRVLAGGRPAPGTRVLLTPTGDEPGLPWSGDCGAIADADGCFEIAGRFAGACRITAWLPGAGAACCRRSMCGRG